MGSSTWWVKVAGGEDDTLWMEDDWSDPHQAFGDTDRVLNPPELEPRSVRVEAARRSGRQAHRVCACRQP